MSAGYYGWQGQGPPPLPPRSPQPPQHPQHPQQVQIPPPAGYSPAYHPQYGYLPPPPPGRPPAQAYAVPTQAQPIPPPIPPRPAGYGHESHVPATSSHGPQSYHPPPPQYAGQETVSSTPAAQTPAQSGQYRPSDSAAKPPAPAPTSTTSAPWAGGEGDMSGLTQGLSGLSVSGPQSPADRLSAANTPTSALRRKPVAPGTSSAGPSSAPYAPSQRPVSRTPAQPQDSSSSESQPVPDSYAHTHSPPAPPAPPPRPNQGALQGPPSSQRQPSLATSPAPAQPYYPQSGYSQQEYSQPEHSQPEQPEYSQPEQPEHSQSEYSEPEQPEYSEPEHSRDAPASPRQALSRPVMRCINDGMKIATTWYTHPSSPEYYICSRCYADYIEPSMFRDDFIGTYLDDGEERVCRFSTVPRMKEVLFPAAVHYRSLNNVVAFMRLRSTIPGCKGVNGVKGTEGIRWFNLTGGEIRGFVVCEACYQDHCLCNAFGNNFRPHPDKQGENDVWACDMAGPCVQRVYAELGKRNDWALFVSEATARLTQVVACPKKDVVAASGRTWFRPKRSSQSGQDMVICGACYCDQVVMTPDEDSWYQDKALSSNAAVKVSCDMHQFNVITPMILAHEKKDWSIFWAAAREFERQPACVAGGIANGTWYTLESNPEDFRICSACFACIVRPLGIGRFFMRKTDEPAGDEALLCSLHPTHARFTGFLNGLLRASYLDDVSFLDTFATHYAAVPVCGRDDDFTNRVWYGWDECTICQECYLDYAQGGLLAEHMPLKGGVRIAGQRLCEMYSPRMRRLYEAACDAGDPTELLQFALQRRAVYFQTMPQIRMMMLQAKLNLQRQQTLAMAGIMLTGTGNMAAAASSYHNYSYGNSTLGYGYDNSAQVQGAMYSQQAQAVGMNGVFNMNQSMLIISQLEPQWRAVE